MLELLFLLLLLNIVPVLKASDPITEIINAIVNGIKKVISTITGGVVDFFGKYFFEPLGKGVANVITSFFGSIAEWAKALGAPFHGVSSAASDIWRNFASYVSGQYGPLGPIVLIAVIGIMIAIGIIFAKRLPTLLHSI